MPSAQFLTLIDAVAPLFAGEAEVIRTYWTSPVRTAETDRLWLRRMAGLYEEFSHYCDFADVYDAMRAPGEDTLSPARLKEEPTWDENRAFLARRAEIVAAHGRIGERARLFTEGGYCTLYSEGMRLAGQGGTEEMIARACAGVYEDEFGHMCQGIAGLDAEGLGDSDWALMTELSAELQTMRIHMRNAQFSYPVAAARIDAIVGGDIEPVAFDFAKAEAYQSGNATNRGGELDPKIIDTLGGGGSPPEPLLTSAPLARLAAEALCRRSESENCSWYHGYWQYLRILGIVATPERHGAFYAGALGELAAAGDYRRILISATADYAMLAHLLKAYDGALDGLAITAVDICETPLMLCKWYAQRHGLTIETQACDLVQEPIDKRFDLIVTHSFLQMVPVAARQKLMANWHQALRPGGKIVSVTRLNPDWTEAHILPDRERIPAFREHAQREATKWQGVLGIDAGELAEAAENYVGRVKNYSLRSEAELRALFTDAGFAFDRLDPVAVKGKSGQPQVGAGTSRSATYAEFVARRT